MMDFFKKFKDVEEQKRAALGEKSELEIMLEKNGNKPVLVFSYNRIGKYETGIYGDGKLLVINHRDYQWSNNSKAEFMQAYLQAFGLTDPLQIADKIEEVHIYIGGGEKGKLGTLEAAAEIAGKPEKLRIYYCSCAERILDGLFDKFPKAKFYKVKCGGREAMEAICKKIAKPEEKNEP